MTARLMDGKALAERIRGEVAEEVRELSQIGLATVLVGDDPASDVYIRLKHKATGEVGINARDIRLASQTTEEELLQQVEELNRDDGIDGLLVQLPLPDHIDEARVIRAIDPKKDVDGLHPLNAGHLYLRAHDARPLFRAAGGREAAQAGCEAAAGGGASRSGPPLGRAAAGTGCAQEGQGAGRGRARGCRSRSRRCGRAHFPPTPPS